MALPTAVAAAAALAASQSCHAAGAAARSVGSPAAAAALLAAARAASTAAALLGEPAPFPRPRRRRRRAGQAPDACSSTPAQTPATRPSNEAAASTVADSDIGFTSSDSSGGPPGAGPSTAMDRFACVVRHGGVSTGLGAISCDNARNDASVRGADPLAQSLGVGDAGCFAPTPASTRDGESDVSGLVLSEDVRIVTVGQLQCFFAGGKCATADQIAAAAAIFAAVDKRGDGMVTAVQLQDFFRHSRECTAAEASEIVDTIIGTIAAYEQRLVQ